VYLVLGTGLFIAAYSAGTAGQLSIEQASNIQHDLAQRNKTINEFSIFANNITPSLEMFIPAVGIGFGVYSAYSTGQAFSAFALTIPALKSISPLSVFVTPFAIMEIVAYGLAISRSFLLSYYLIRYRKSLKQSWRKYLVPTVIEIGIVIVVILVGSIIEWQIIQQRQKL
jgi:uncharacterized membrane protein SpoIIM required for sporulation